MAAVPIGLLTIYIDSRYCLGMPPALREPTYHVLAALLDGPLHGYGIMRQARERSQGRVRLTAGTLYGALDRLSVEGLVEVAREEVVEGRARRYYRLTDEGRATISEEARRLAAAAAIVTDHPSFRTRAEPSR